MLSTGTIGPDFSWDKRIKKLTPDSSVQLDKENWSLIINENSFKIESKQLSYEKHKKDLLNAIQNTLRSLLNLDFSRWPITLSGGYDSRAILCKLKQLGPNNQFIALTHGSEGSLDTIGSDANIARQLTEKLNIQHKFHKIEKTSISIKKVIDRFIKQSDGTTDHITAYMDGMDMWKNFVEKEKFFGIIRGDVVFHPQKIKTPLQARKMVGLLLCSDFSNLNKLANDFNLPDQVLPVSLRKNKNESVTDWREKIYQRFRVPTIHSALSSIKLSYVEMINPLLSKRVVKQVNSMPDSFRKDKSIFKDIVESLSPDVPYTSAPSLSKQDVISTPDFLHVITNKLNDSYSRHLLGSVFIDQVLSKVKQRKKAVPAKKVKSKKIKVSSLLLYITPKFIHKIYQKYKSKPDLNPNILAFRIFIIVRTHELFNEESKVQRQYKDLKLKR
ncbi:MAG: hypothetical protein JJU13_18260 [Balneolaceae bacterium]|nr:hypothetical protein [Balneolaceae bacterium]